MTKTYCFWFKFCCLLNFASAQQVENVFHWQSESLLSFQSMTFSEESTFVGGIFEEKIEQPEIDKQSLGKNDIFLAQLDENGEVLWLQTGGSTENDELIKIIHAKDQLYATGTFWVEGQFGDIQLQVENGSKSIFLLNYSTKGEGDWGISIDGTGSKNVSDIAVDHQGNLLLTGSFKDSLFFNNQAILFSEQQSFFLIKLDQNGSLLWSKQANEVMGKIEGIALGVSEENEVVITGNFIGKMQIAGIQIETNTEDENVFIANFSESGAFRWLRTAGGVFPDEVVDIQFIENQIYLVGNYFGRLQVTEEITIESIGLNENVFLLTYNKNGEATAARNIGDVDSEQVISMDILDNQMVLGGFFRERMKVDDFVIVGNEDSLDGFVLLLDLDGNPIGLRALNSDGNLLVNEVHFRSPKQIQTIGDFIGNAQFDNFQLEALAFNPFLITIRNPATSTKKTTSQFADFQIINHQGHLQILTNKNIQSLQIFDTQGKLLSAQRQANQISTLMLPNGIYLIHIKTQNGKQATQLFTKLN